MEGEEVEAQLKARENGGVAGWFVGRMEGCWRQR